MFQPISSPRTLERRLVQGLRGRGHLAEMEQHGDQRGRVDVDLLGQVGQRGALTQTDGLAVAGGDAHAADGRGLQLLELLAFREPVLTRLRGLAALTAECAGRATATAAAAACGTVVRGTALMATGRIAAETVAADRTVAGTALTGTMLAPLPGLGLRALARTATEASTAAALTRTAIAAAATAVLDGRASHRMRTRDVARRGGMHPLLAAERIVAGTGTALAGAVLRLLAVALRGGTTVVLLAGLLMPTLALAGLRGRAMMPRLAGLLGGGSGLRARRGRLRGRMRLLRMGGGGRGLGRRHRLGGRHGFGRGRLRGRGLVIPWHLRSARVRRRPWGTPPSGDGRTGGSTVDDADLTNSPISLSFSRTVLLSTPSSLAKSYTRAFGTQFSYSATARMPAVTLR